MKCLISFVPLSFSICIKEKINHSFDMGAWNKVPIKIIWWNNIVLFSFTLTFLMQSHFNRPCRSESDGPFIISPNSLSKSIPRDIKNAKQGQTKIKFISWKLQKQSLQLNMGKNVSQGVIGDMNIRWLKTKPKHRSLQNHQVLLWKEYRNTWFQMCWKMA